MPDQPLYRVTVISHFGHVIHSAEYRYPDGIANVIATMLPGDRLEVKRVA